MKNPQSNLNDFRFKRFAVSHSRSSMKIGVDSVLIGAWCACNGKSGLDVGCGCGVIALMLAQRNDSAFIDAIDIHEDSVSESDGNFSRSPWSGRLRCLKINFVDFAKNPEHVGTFDFIVSNPPYFDSGVEMPSSAREVARHQDSLSPQTLLNLSESLLKEDGTLSFIMPTENYEGLVFPANLTTERICWVSDRPAKPSKRVMITARKARQAPCMEERLYIRDEAGEYSDDYRSLTSSFYLKF